jgi:hypothetical protein
MFGIAHGLNNLECPFVCLESLGYRHLKPLAKEREVDPAF